MSGSFPVRRTASRLMSFQVCGDIMKQMPPNLRKICEGQRSDLTAEQIASYEKICREYRDESTMESHRGTHRKESNAAKSMPSLLIRGWNFARAMSRWTLAGMPRRTPEEIGERLAICQSCEFLHNDHCAKCGCACVEKNQLINKLALSTETCPEGRWS